MGEDLLQWAIRIRDRVPELVETAQVADVTRVLDGLIDDGRAFAAGFEEFLQREPGINDWLNRQLNDAPEVYRSYQDLPGEMRFVPSGVIARCPDEHTWQLPAAAAWLPPCPNPDCGKALRRV